MAEQGPSFFSLAPSLLWGVGKRLAHSVIAVRMNLAVGLVL